MQFLGGQQGETVGQVEAHLMTEDALGACSRPICLHSTLIEDALQEV